MDKKKESRRRNFEMLRSQLDQERSSFLPVWRECGEYVLPRRPRFLVSDTNRGERRNQKIIDGTGTYAARTLRSGMMSGVTSPARPWFRLATPDPDMMDYTPVKEWLHIVTQRMTTGFLRSNLYNVLPIVYGDIGTFGTSSMIIERDPDKVFRFFPFPIGSYWIANNHKLQVDTFIREFRMTVRQIIQKFGVRNEETGAAKWDNFSTYIKSLWDNGNYETWIDITHVIRPNELFDENKISSKYKKFTSCYYENGGSTKSSGSYMSTEDDTIMLSEKGYDFFPVLAPRWEVTGEDTYGTSWPAVDALGDLKALQTMQKRKAQAIEKMVNPPMKGPTSLRTVKTSLLPGDITYHDETPERGFTPIHEVNPRIQELLMDIQDNRQMVSRAFFEDLFLMLAQSDRQMTAREVSERHEEKLLALGPVLEQLNQDLLDPLIDNAFQIMATDGMIPEPPEEIQGMDLKVEYISVMAQAQKMVGLSNVERFFSFVGQAAQFDPNVLKKVNMEQAIDLYGDMLSVPPSLIRSDDEMEEMKQAEAQAVAAQQRMAAIQQSANTAKTLSQTDTSKPNALTALMGGQAAG